MTYNKAIRMPQFELIAITPLRPLSQCANCLNSFAQNQQKFQCSNCKSTLYCSQNCQESHWRAHHKDECLKVKSTDEILRFRLKQQSVEYNLANLLAFIVLPTADQIIQPIQYQDYDKQKHVGKFVALVSNYQFTFDSSKCNTLVLVENLKVYFKQEGATIILFNYSDYHLKSEYNGLRFLCSECGGPVADEACLKCNNQLQVTDEMKDSQQKLNQFVQHSLYCLTSPNNDKSLAKQQYKYMQFQNDEDFIHQLCQLLKLNHIHHLSFPLLYPLSLLFRLLKKVNTSNFYKVVGNLTYPTDIYSLSFAFAKQSIHQFGMYSGVTLQNLRIICEILNFYTLNELEQQGCPPLMEEMSNRVQVSQTEMERMQNIAKELIQGHKNALNFCSQLKELVERTKDEQLSEDVGRLVGAVDTRVENLESWLGERNDDTEEKDELIVKGKEWTGQDQEMAGHKVDIIQ